MRPKLYEASRMLTTQGISADIKFDPTQVTTRLRNSIRKQVESGVMTGGWSSHASRIAKILCNQFGVKYTDKTWYGVRIPVVSKEYREQFIELVQADIAAYILDDDAPYNHTWEKEHAEQSVQHIKTGRETNVRTHSQHYQEKLRDLIMTTRTPRELAHAKEVAAMIDAGQPITITNVKWKD